MRLASSWRFRFGFSLRIFASAFSFVVRVVWNWSRRALYVGADVELVGLSAIRVSTLVTHADDSADARLNYGMLEAGMLKAVEDRLPEGTRHVVISGGAHMDMQPNVLE